MLLKNGERIVFTGDSVTDSGRKRPVGDGLWEGTGTGFVRLVESFLNVFYPERLIRVSNTGNSGDTSKALLNRFDTDVISLKPNYVVICIGFNDVWRHFDEPTITEGHVGTKEYKANLEKMADLCAKEGIKAIFMTPYYMELNEQDAMRKMTVEYATEMKLVAQEKGLPCIDLQPAFDQLLQYRYPAYLSWDRVHPGHTGSMLIATEFLKFAGFDFDRIKGGI